MSFSIEQTGDWHRIETEGHFYWGELAPKGTTRLLSTDGVTQLRVVTGPRSEMHGPISGGYFAGHFGHPNIVNSSYHGFGSLPGYRGIELVVNEAPSTNRNVKTQWDSLFVPEFISYLGQALEALDELHRHGVTHTTVSPEHIALYETGAKLDNLRDAFIDPNNAEFFLEMPTHIRNHYLRRFAMERVQGGVYTFTSPEQARGGIPTPAVDIFAVGQLVYEFLAGEPFHGESSDIHIIGNAAKYDRSDWTQKAARFKMLLRERKGIGQRLEAGFDVANEELLAAIHPDKDLRPSALELKESLDKFKRAFLS